MGLQPVCLNNNLNLTPNAFQIAFDTTQTCPARLDCTAAATDGPSSSLQLCRVSVAAPRGAVQEPASSHGCQQGGRHAEQQHHQLSTLRVEHASVSTVMIGECFATCAMPANGVRNASCAQHQFSCMGCVLSTHLLLLVLAINTLIL